LTWTPTWTDTETATSTHTPTWTWTATPTSTWTIACPAPVTLGYTGTGSNEQAAGTMYFHPITVTTAGTITDLYVYARATGAYSMALYSGSAGQPGTILARSVPVTLDGAPAEYQRADIPDVPVSGGGAVYWVAFWAEDGISFSGFNAPPDTAFSLSDTQGAYPDPFSGGTPITRQHRNFAVLCP